MGIQERPSRLRGLDEQCVEFNIYNTNTTQVGQFCA